MSAFADRTALLPGGAFRIAVQFELEPKWHIYWTTGGEPGSPAMPTNVSLIAGPGFQVGPARFPTPQTKKTPDGDVFILEGRPVVLFDVVAPAELPAGPVTFTAKADWLVCSESCIPGACELKLTLPVASSPQDSRPANEELFRRAAAALPIPADQASYVRLRPSLSQDRVRPGDAFEVRLEIEIKAGHHIQSHVPANADLIASNLYLEPAAGIEWGKVEYPPAQRRRDPVLGELLDYGGRVTFVAPAKASNSLAGDAVRIRGVLRAQACNESGSCFPPEEVGFELTAPLAPAGAIVNVAPAVARPGGSGAGSETAVGPAANAGGVGSWYVALAFLFVGGLILNVMPCVLPVISIKVLSFVQQAGESRRRILQLGLIFSAGIVASFVALAGIIVGLQAGGEQVGWGFLSQSPWFNVAMGTLVFAFALSLLGVWEITLPGASANVLGEYESREGALGTFFKGILATILAVPCLGPFLGSAIAFALAKPPAQIVAYFAVMGLGMALPYLLLAAFPAWLRFIPRPGPWMETFKQAMGFLLLLTVLFLLVVVSQQIGSDGLLRTLGLLLSVAIGCWIVGRLRYDASAARKTAAWGLALLFAAGGGWTSFHLLRPLDVHWVKYQVGDEERLSREGYTVFVDFTATWCLTCQANKRYLFSDRDVLRTFKELNVLPLKCDWTNREPEILAQLQKYNRAGVPVNLIVPAGRPQDVTVLPEQLVFRKQLVLDALKAAGPSRKPLPQRQPRQDLED